MKVRITLARDDSGTRIVPFDNLFPVIDDRSYGKNSQGIYGVGDFVDLLGDWIAEPIPGYFRIKIDDTRWAQNGRVITLARTDIDRLEIVDDARVVREPVTETDQPVAESRTEFLEIGERKKKDEPTGGDSNG